MAKKTAIKTKATVPSKRPIKPDGSGGSFPTKLTIKTEKK